MEARNKALAKKRMDWAISAAFGFFLLSMKIGSMMRVMIPNRIQGSRKPDQKDSFQMSILSIKRGVFVDKTHL